MKAAPGKVPGNSEPYSYETGFAVKWLIEEQIKNEPALNYDSDKGEVKAPWLSWGPYLWARGETGRQADNLSWTRADFDHEGTHPSAHGAEKIGRLLLKLMQTDPAARPWFMTK